ncbi:MAG: hypothetical protein MI702_01120 [Chlorobiales bacterium]|nr:hypothetical protein [Chlorobiales bacterium]
MAHALARDAPTHVLVHDASAHDAPDHDVLDHDALAHDALAPVQALALALVLLEVQKQELT